MKVLHYSLGLPPYRSGGLTKYSYDLMKEERSRGIDIINLFPGKMNFKEKDCRIIPYKFSDFKVYEIVNPLPVPLLGGIKQVDKFMKKIDITIYKKFLLDESPDIIHIHTLMGLHSEFIEAAKELNIKTVFTTHDYFGICPKVNLLDYNSNICLDYNNGFKCITCNQNAYSIDMIKIMQSPLYRRVKETGILRLLRKRKKNNIAKEKIETIEEIEEESIQDNKKEEYVKLRQYYLNMLSMIDIIHFNSSVTKKVYEKYNINHGGVKSITHSGIKQHKTIKAYSSKNPLKILYLGPMESYKGFYELKKALDMLKDNGITNWKLEVYGDDRALNENNCNISFNGKYDYEDLPDIFDNNDVLIVPSKCFETFGFVVLEAISFSMPVIVTSNIGAKDIIENNITGLIIEDSYKEIYDILNRIINDRKILEDINHNLINYRVKTLKEHVNEIVALYKYGLGDGSN